MVDRDDDEDEGSGASPIDLAKSYGAYAVRALRLHTRVAIVGAVGVVLLVGVALAIWPRSYTCTTVLSAVDNKVLDGERSTESLRGAEEVILNRDNIVSIVDEVKLTSRWSKTMPPLSRFKQKVSIWLHGGEMSEHDKRDALVQMVQTSLSVIPPGWNQNKLTISADWNDPHIAADLAEAADQSFLRARHVAEISTITEYIGILEGHAAELRLEIEKFANQNQQTRDEKLAELTKRNTPQKDQASPAPVFRAAAPSAPRAPVEDLTEAKAQLELKQRALKDLEDSQARRRADAEAALTQLRTKFTDAHPMVVAAENNVAQLSQDTPQIAALRSDVNALSAALKSKSAAADLAANGGPRVAAVPPSAGIQGASGVEPLPAEIMKLMQDDKALDPAVSAQFKGAVDKYAVLRDKIGTARVDLDTAQAAFKHRYVIVIPAEAPAKPSKPKVPLILAAGVLGALVIGWLLAIIAELRTGKVVERWQVYNLGIPLLGELRWPPSGD